MNAKKILFPLLLVGGALWLAARRAARSGPQAVGKPGPGHDPYAALDAYLEREMRRLSIPGLSLAIVEGEQVTHFRGFGRARPGGEAPTPQTPFMIGSMTKSFTALAVMQLVEARKVELDAPVQRYLPWFQLADRGGTTQITVRHLLNQTSGIPVGPGWEQLADFDARPDAAERQARSLLASLDLNHAPGTKFEYSNLNYNLLGLVVEAASGETYAGYVEKHIFLQLGMGHSYTSQAAAKRDGLAMGHRLWFWTPIPAPGLPIPRGSLASGQLVSSAEDMARYLIAHLNDGRYGGAQVLSEGGIAELHRPAADASVGGWVGQYAMGWYDEPLGGTRLVWHTGTVPDFGSYMALLPGQKKGLVLLANADHFMLNPILSEVGRGAAALLAGQRPPESPFGILRIVPWVIRALALIPLAQIAGGIATLRRVNRWRAEPGTRPSRNRLWGQHVLLPLIPNLALAAVSIVLLRSKLRGFLLLFAPETAVGMGCGAFAAVWAGLRTGLVLKWGARR